MTARESLFPFNERSDDALHLQDDGAVRVLPVSARQEVRGSLFSFGYRNVPAAWYVAMPIVCRHRVSHAIHCKECALAGFCGCKECQRDSN